MGFKKRYVLFCFLFCFSASADLLDLSLQYSNYLTSTDRKNLLDHYVSAGLDLKYYNRSGSWFYGAEMVTLFSLDESRQNHITIPDLFIGHAHVFKGVDWNVVLGKQKSASRFGFLKDQNSNEKALSSHWSFMDELWGLGLWEGKINWDYLQPKSKGLSGLFFTLKKKHWFLTLFASGLFFPDLGPAVDIKEGKVSSQNRWFIPPQSEFVVFSQRIEGLYWLEEPYLKNVILSDSLAFQFFFGDQKSGWLSIAGARKPVNQIYFKLDSGFSIDKNAFNSVIHHQPFKHLLFSMDLGLNWSILEAIFSGAYESPNRPVQPEEQTALLVPVLPKALFLSSHLKLNLEKYRFLLNSLHFNFLYSRFISEQKQKESNNPLLELDLHKNRFRLYYGFAVSALSQNFKLGKQTVSLKGSYWYSVPEEGGWLNGALLWHLTPRLSVEASVDILGANIDKQEFFNLYKQNDRAQVKVTYEVH